MSKKSKQSRKNRHRQAARRARRTARRAASRRQAGRRHADASSKQQPMQSITFTHAGVVDLVEVPPEDVEVHLAYLAAHRVLPPHFPRSEEEQQREMTMALFTLDDPQATSAAVLRAIMILAHTADDRALEALHRYAENGSVHADLAKPAAQECAMWLGHDEGIAPRGPAPAAPMWN